MECIKHRIFLYLPEYFEFNINVVRLQLKRIVHWIKHVSHISCSIFHIQHTFLILSLFSSFVSFAAKVKINSVTLALHHTEALMAGYLKSQDLGHQHPHAYGAPHPHHAGHPHASLGPGMPMSSLSFGLTHGLDAVSFPQSVWGKYITFVFFPKGKQSQKKKKSFSLFFFFGFWNINFRLSDPCLSDPLFDWYWLSDIKIKRNDRNENGVNKTINWKLKSLFGMRMA